MIKTAQLEKIIELVLWSGYVKNERPLSLLVIAKSEAGKTSVLKKFIVNKGIAYKSDFTAFGLMRDVIPLVVRKEIRHILCPDLLRPFSRRQTVVKELTAFLNSLIEDGVINASTFFSPQQFMADKMEELKCGLIGCITKDEFYEQQELWQSMGFIRRTIPFTYSYSQSDVVAILNSIITQAYHKENPIKLWNEIPVEKEIKMDDRFAERLLPFTLRYAEARRLYGFSAQKQFQILLKASALSRNDDRVTDTDLETVSKLFDWINIDFNPL